MLAELKFVQGAIAKKDIVPELTHFSIKNGVVKGFNGSLALSSPIALNLECQPKAIPFIKAIEACHETVQLNLTPTGRLAVKSGKFKAFVDCDSGSFPDVRPEGDHIELNGNLLAALKVLEPFIAEDASRPWARGILFRGNSAFATNNVVLVEHWLGYTLGFDLNIPHGAVNELLRIGEEPVAMQVSPNSATFLYEGDRWLRTQTFSTEWPDVARVLNRPAQPSPIPDGFFDAVETLYKFVEKENRLYFAGDRMGTSIDDGSGAWVDCPGTPAEGCFNVQFLRMIGKVATSVDMTQIPGGPLMFFGDNLRGACAGIRV